MRALFVIAHLGFLRNFQQTIQRLLEAGHVVDVLPCKLHETIKEQDFELVCERRAGFRVIEVPQLEISRERARRRFYRDIVHYCRPEFRDNDLSWARLAASSKQLVSAETLAWARRQWWLRLGWVRRLVARISEAREYIEPANRGVLARLDELRPDIVVVSPLVTFHSQELEFLKAARRRGIPTLFAVASWDNLVNKGVLKLQPDQVACWNAAMAKEARHYHSVPARRIFITGSPIFDVWFGRKPSSDRKTFLSRLGLDTDRPVILYLCSSDSIAGRNECRLVAAWCKRLRESDDHPARDANIIVRPHPMNLGGWADAEIADSQLAVWPRSPTHPSDEETRRDFFDSIFHANAVVGINTSGMVEAAIVGTPVFCLTLREDEIVKGLDARWCFDHQLEHLHFDHLLESGYVKSSVGFDNHFAQLKTAFVPEPQADGARRAAAFVARFIRPLGGNVEASSRLAERIVEMAAGTSKTDASHSAALKQVVACSND